MNPILDNDTFLQSIMEETQWQHRMIMGRRALVIREDQTEAFRERANEIKQNHTIINALLYVSPRRMICNGLLYVGELNRIALYQKV